METTINMHAIILDKIKAEARARKVSCSALIVLLMQRVMKEHTDSALMGIPVQYQKRSDTGDWRTLHVRLVEDEYEYFLDMRRLLKMSVSLIVACAVQQYLFQPDDELFADNNPFTSYFAVKIFMDTIPCWILFWGHPKQLCELLPNPLDKT